MNNYVKLIADYFTAHDIPAYRVVEAFVFHDDGCGIYKGTACDCAPDIKFGNEWIAKNGKLITN